MSSYLESSPFTGLEVTRFASMPKAAAYHSQALPAPTIPDALDCRARDAKGPMVLPLVLPLTVTLMLPHWPTRYAPMASPPAIASPGAAGNVAFGRYLLRHAPLCPLWSPLDNSHEGSEG